VGTPHVLIHDKADNVGVVVAERVNPGETLLCVTLEDDSDSELEATDTISLGHKIALSDLKEGDTVVKYGQDIGRIVSDVRRGGHVHVHNLKTKRW